MMAGDIRTSMDKQEGLQFFQSHSRTYDLEFYPHLLGVPRPTIGSEYISSVTRVKTPMKNKINYSAEFKEAVQNLEF